MPQSLAGGLTSSTNDTFFLGAGVGAFEVFEAICGFSPPGSPLLASAAMGRVADSSAVWLPVKLVLLVVASPRVSPLELLVASLVPLL